MSHNGKKIKLSRASELCSTNTFRAERHCTLLEILGCEVHPSNQNTFDAGCGKENDSRFNGTFSGHHAGGRTQGQGEENQTAAAARVRDGDGPKWEKDIYHLSTQPKYSEQAVEISRLGEIKRVHSEQGNRKTRLAQAGEALAT